MIAARSAADSRRAARLHAAGSPDCLLAAALLAATCVASLAIGTENVSLSTVWQAVTDYRDIGDQWIVHDLRIPRTVLALLVGTGSGPVGNA